MRASGSRTAPGSIPSASKKYCAVWLQQPTSITFPAVEVVVDDVRVGHQVPV